MQGGAESWNVFRGGYEGGAGGRGILCGHIAHSEKAGTEKG